MADTYAISFKNLIKNRSKTSRLQYTMSPLPFTVAQELYIAGAIIDVYKVHQRRMSKEIIKDEVKDDLITFGILNWSLEDNFDDWYIPFLHRHPGLLQAVEKPSITSGYREALNEMLFENEVPEEVDFNVSVDVLEPKRARIEKDEYADITDDELHLYVVDVKRNKNGQKEGQLVWRKLKENETTNEMVFMYGNFLFNMFGFVDGLLVGVTREKVTNSFVVDYVNTVKKYHSKHNASKAMQTISVYGCSFDQEIEDGLRVHVRHCFSWNVYVADDEAVIPTKWLTRHSVNARCSLNPLVTEMVAPAAFVTFLERKLDSVIQSIELPEDGSSMLRVEYDLRLVFEQSNDVSEVYKTRDCWDLYVAECNAHCYFVAGDLFSNGRFTLALQKLFKVKSKSRSGVRAGVNYSTSFITGVRPVVATLQKVKLADPQKFFKMK